MLNLVKVGIIYRQLTDRDFRVLNAIEKGMASYKYVPLEVIERYTRIPETKLELSLSKLHRLKLVKRQYMMYKGYRLTYLGLDMLALKYFVDRDIVVALGDRIGVGKESELFKALAPGDINVIIKFLRIGRTSFRSTRRVRAFADNPRYDWYRQSKIAAEREYKALHEIYLVGGSVPKPLAYNRHSVVIGYINGIELYKKPDLLDPYETATIILDTLRKAFIDVGIIHGDLSEYNVLVDRDTGKPYIIDWPQYVEKLHPSAEKLLRRDIEYIVRFFKKNYRVILDTNRALKYVKGELETA